MASFLWAFLRVLYDIIAIVPIITVAAVINTIPPFKRGYFENDESLKYPYYPSTVKSIYLFTVIPAIAVVVITSTELVRARNYGFAMKFKRIPLIVIYLYKFYYLLGFGYAITSMLVHIGKIVIGRLRPHFFAICIPTPISTTPYITEYKCGGLNQELLHDMRLSFPSGHSAYSMFAAIFIVVYLHYRMPRIAVGSVLQAFIQVAAVSGAFYVGLSRISDNKHHPTDVLAGMLIGLLVGIFCVRYASDIHEFDEIEEDGSEHLPFASKRE